MFAQGQRNVLLFARVDRRLRHNLEQQASTSRMTTFPSAAGSRKCVQACRTPRNGRASRLLCASSRRRVVLAAPCIACVQSLLCLPASAFVTPPDGYRIYLDQLDGFVFNYPDSWIGVTSSGNEVFKRNPRVADENAFVVISSPSSSQYESVADFGSPDDASARLQDQFLREYMSTRIGVRREIQPLFARSRTGETSRACSVPLR